MQTYEIAISTGSNDFSTVKRLASMDEAIAWAKEFGSDWYRGAEYGVFCRETEEAAQGRAN